MALENKSLNLSADLSKPTKKSDGQKCDFLSGFKFSSAIAENMDIKSMMAEAPDQIRVKNVLTQMKKRVPLMTQIKIVNCLNDRDIKFGGEEKEFVPDEKKTWDELKDEVIGSRNLLKSIRKLTEKERSRKLLQAQADLEVYETMSGYWRLLENYEDFKISYPGYDAYRGPSKHWLQADPIPWTVMEESRSKVLHWFSKYFNPSK